MFLSGKKLKLGLVLSGGGARGFAHIGVLKALHDEGIRPDVISASSAGAIVGAFYADGYSPDEILEIFNRKKMLSYVNMTFPRKGFFRMTGLEHMLNMSLRTKTFESLKTPMVIAVTNYTTGRVEYIESGNLISYIIASCSIPVVFNPVEINGNIYIDGGVADNLPVLPIAERCRRILGSHVNPLGYQQECSNMLEIAQRAFHIGAAENIKHNKHMINVLIEPADLAKYSILDVSHGYEMFVLGYNETKRLMKSIKQLL